MSKTAPGKHYRNGITFAQPFQMFPDDEVAEKWFVETRWPDGLRCAHCDGENVGERGKHPRMPYHCGDCRKFFSVMTNSVMHSSKVGYQKWAIAIYLMTTNLIRRPHGTWLMGFVRLGKATMTNCLQAPRVDEAYIGGKEANKHADKKLRARRGAVGKTPVVGMKDRSTNHVDAEVVESTNKQTLHGFIEDRTDRSAIVYTDEHAGYRGIPRLHESVRHSVGEYVRDSAHTNGTESFWSMLKRGYTGTYHEMSPKHLHRYVGEFQGWHNARSLDRVNQMAALVQGAAGKRLRYDDLIAE